MQGAVDDGRMCDARVRVRIRVEREVGDDEALKDT